MARYNQYNFILHQSLCTFMLAINVQCIETIKLLWPKISFGRQDWKWKIVTAIFSLELQSESGLDHLHCTPLGDIQPAQFMDLNMSFVLCGWRGSPAPYPNPQPGGLFVLQLGQTLCGMGSPTMTQAAASLAFEFIDACKAPHFEKHLPLTQWRYHQAGANKMSSIFFWKRGRWFLHVAAVSRLVSDQDLLKGGGWSALGCIVHFILKTFSILIATLACFISMIY